MKKRFVAILLLLTFILGTFSFNVAAAEKSSVDEYDQMVYDFVNYLKILQYDYETGEFNPDKLITRAQLAGYWVASTKTETQKTTGYEALFKDLSSEHKNYGNIKAAVDKGAMKATDGRFRPDAYATTDDAVLAFVVAAGYGELISFGANPIQIGRKIGLTDGISLGESLSRHSLAHIIYNTMHAGYCEQEIYNVDDITFVDGKISVLERYFDIRFYDGVVDGINSTTLTNPDGGNGDGKFRVNGYEFIGDMSFDYLGYNIRCYYTEDDKICTMDYFSKYADRNETLIVNSEDIDPYATRNFKYYDGDRTRTFRIKNEADVIYNNAAYPAVDPSVDFNFEHGTKFGYIEFVDNTLDGVYDVVKIYSYEIFIAKAGNAETNALYKKFGGTIGGTDDYEFDVYLNGANIRLDQISEDNVVAVVQPKSGSARTVRVEVLPIHDEGTINITTNKTLSVNGKTYEIENLIAKDKAYKVGEEVQLYMLNDKLVGLLHSPEVAYTFGYLQDAAVVGEDAFSTMPPVSKLKFKIYSSKSGSVIYDAAKTVKVDGTVKNKADGVLGPLATAATTTSFYEASHLLAQPILFKTNTSGQIKEIVTAGPEADRELQRVGVAEADKSGTTTTGGLIFTAHAKSLFNASDSNKFVGAIDSTTEAIYVPRTKRGDDNLYSSTLNPSWKDGTGNGESGEVFNVNEVGAAEYLIIYSDDALNTNQEADYPALVSEIRRELIDEEEKIVIKVATSKGETELIVASDCSVKQFDKNAANTAAMPDISLSDIEAGDIIAYKVLGGEICVIEKRFDKDGAVPASTDRVTSKYKGTSQFFFQGKQSLIYGTICNVGAERITHTTVLPNESINSDYSANENYNSYAVSGSVPIYKFNDRTGLEKITKTDLVPHSVDSSNASVAIIVAHDGKVQFIYVVN